ncbi:hypothetical protein SOV78_08660 [Pectobacterium brasiliense]|uniref:hypothetical protein n=1 Tax=Pectobacterium brasiliense TaxID=180957 RepID=UPI002A82BA85|nr:hypothetical protein [Pectobacterium brasiliense]MDY4334068.1 hypothetical protein [Pectobacterium brasiliense]
MENLAYNWSPELIVDLIKSIAWPVVVLLIGFSFRIRIFEIIHSFFSKNMVSEISATVSGVSAKFVAEKQSTEVLETASSNATNLPKYMDIGAIRERHEQHKTELSEELYQAITIHISSLKTNNEIKVDLLAREVSLFQSAIKYFDINKVLFRSQYNLFSIMANNEGCIRKEDAHRIFESIKKHNKEVFSDWDWIKYIAYPVSNSLIYEDTNSYKLTSTGRSYVSFMSKNPQLIDELAKL